MKKLAAALLVLCAIAGAVLYWLSGNLDGLIKNAIAHYGKAMTKAEVAVGSVNIAPADGKGAISDLVIGNPPGFKTAHAMKVGRIELEVDAASMPKDVIVIRRIAIQAPDVIYEKGDAMTNFDAIQKNIAAYLGPKKQGKGGTRLIIEELTLCNARAQASAGFMGGKTVSIPLPDISLKNVGKAKGGISPGELGQEIANALKAKLSVAGNFERLKNSTGEVLDKAGSAIKGLLK